MTNLQDILRQDLQKKIDAWGKQKHIQGAMTCLPGPPSIPKELHAADAALQKFLDYLFTKHLTEP